MKELHKSKFFILLIIMQILLCTSCNDSNDNTSSYTYKTKDILTSITNSTDALPKMEYSDSENEDGESLFDYVCNYDYSKIEEYAFTYASDGTAPWIAVIKLKDSSDMTSLVSALETKVKERRSQYETYAPNEVSIVDKYQVSYNGPYVALVICGQSSLGITTFNNYFN